MRKRVRFLAASKNPFPIATIEDLTREVLLSNPWIDELRVESANDRCDGAHQLDIAITYDWVKMPNQRPPLTRAEWFRFLRHVFPRASNPFFLYRGEEEVNVQEMRAEEAAKLLLKSVDDFVDMIAPMLQEQPDAFSDDQHQAFKRLLVGQGKARAALK